MRIAQSCLKGLNRHPVNRVSTRGEVSQRVNESVGQRPIYPVGNTLELSSAVLSAKSVASADFRVSAYFVLFYAQFRNMADSGRIRLNPTFEVF